MYSDIWVHKVGDYEPKQIIWVISDAFEADE